MKKKNIKKVKPKQKNCVHNFVWRFLVAEMKNKRKERGDPEDI